MKTINLLMRKNKTYISSNNNFSVNQALCVQFMKMFKFGILKGESIILSDFKHFYMILNQI